MVEVAWKGKFRLESLDIYQGLAWWSAVVVDKRQDGSRYKIHYPGWDPRWDEWVHRDRLRWTVEQDLNLRIVAHDDVEIWCCGSNVPGAWLEAKVRKGGRAGGRVGQAREEQTGTQAFGHSFILIILCRP